MWPFNFKYPHTEYHARQENNQYPYTDYHIIDLDWFVEQIKSLWDYVAEHIVEFPLSIGKGGTGAENAAGARTNLGLGAVATEDIVPVSKGGTEAATAAGARTNLGLGAVATENIVPITKGGTGADNAADARVNLGIEETTVSFPITLEKGGTGVEAQSLQELYNLLNLAGLGDAEIISNVSLNTITTPGVYNVNASCTNTPATGFDGKLYVIKPYQSVSRIAYQFAVSETNVYYRLGYGLGTWSGWVKFITSRFSYLTVDKGGTGADNAAAARQNLGIIDAVYPVGSIYMSVNNTSPATLFGGTWEQITDRFLIGAGGSYNSGDIGGEAEHTLTINEMPSHRHGAVFNVVGSGDAFQINGASRTGDSSPYAYTDFVGGSQPHNNIPPYFAVYMWRRVS